MSFEKLQKSLNDPSLFRDKAYVNGEWIEAVSKKRFKVINPANGSEIGSCPEMDKSDTISAINHATAAFETFQRSHPKQRATYLKNWYNLMIQHRDDLAKILSWENGRPISGSADEINYAASFFDWFQGEAVRIYGDTVQGSVEGNRVLTIRQPVGVVGILTPWNYPSGMITRKAGAAIAAGCSVVIKPAGETPYSALALAELAERAGIPKGVINVITTDENTGSWSGNVS